MLVGNAREESRAAAHVYERGLLPGRRKRLGQFFTGLPLGRLLAHLALLPETRSVLDPMAGHGDLLDATWEAATQRGIPLVRLDGVEVDAPTAEVCRRRLAHIAGIDPTPTRAIVPGDAFVPATMAALPQRTYDLITQVVFARLTASGSMSKPVATSRRASMPDIPRLLAALITSATIGATECRLPAGRRSLRGPAAAPPREFQDAHAVHAPWAW